ncbi:MAG: hypothetical protein A2Y33_13165 [Spirochaetes bacterium GWF1_51_8]|nr:MAG: hypothetical protein A2Y33_13165 [Spirochaetes bacterium GWF1_51_8]
MELRDILSIIHAQQHRLKEFGVRKIGVFGSIARNEAKDGSDLDLIVEFKTGFSTFKNYMRLYDFLEEVTGKKVDLLTSEGVSPHIKPYIDKEIVYEEL